MGNFFIYSINTKNGDFNVLHGFGLFNNQVSANDFLYEREGLDVRVKEGSFVDMENADIIFGVAPLTPAATKLFPLKTYLVQAECHGGIKFHLITSRYALKEDAQTTEMLQNLLGAINIISITKTEDIIQCTL